MASYQNTPSETDETARLSCSAVVGAARDVDAEEAARAVPPLPQLDLDALDIPELRALSDADVDAMLADSALLEAFADSLPAVVDNAPAAERCRKLAAELRALEAETAPLWAEAATARAALDAASARHSAAVAAQRDVDARLSAAASSTSARPPRPPRTPRAATSSTSSAPGSSRPRRLRASTSTRAPSRTRSA